MRRLADNRVELTEEELAANGYFNKELDKGISVEGAMLRTKFEYPDLDPAYYEWLLNR